MVTLKMFWFGSPHIEINDQTIRTDRRKAVALLAYLTLEPGEHRRDQLAALFWPDFDASSAHAYLRRTLWEIHRMIGSGWLETGRDMVSMLNLPDVWVDVWEFERLTSTGASRLPTLDGKILEQAASLYRGDLLSGFTLRDSLGFDAWQQQRSESLRLKLFDVLRQLVEVSSQAGNPTEAVTYASRWVGIDPLNESAQRSLMESYARAGQRSAALRQYDQCVELLRNELGAAPEVETRQLAEKIRKGGLQTQSVQLTTATDEQYVCCHVPLPVYPTAFIGRETELLEIQSLLSDPQCRLITLLGPGGSGKTRLAVEAGQQLTPQYKHGVGYVSLAAIREIESILPAIGRALNLSYRVPSSEAVLAAEAEAQLLSYLREKQLLLITDNWEHLLEGCPVLSELLTEAPGLKILATSRERLNLPEEWVIDVPGLTYPTTTSNGGLEDYSAYQLFVQSARRSLSSFNPDAAQKANIVELCRTLEGLPLGIELAASWVRTMDCGEILTEIHRNINFLETNLRGIPARHRSLRAVFDHSWGLISTAEREIMKRLSIFRGGFSREAAERVAGATIDQLAALMDKSLITRDPAGRFGMHEVLKQFSAQNLEADSQAFHETHDLHSNYYLDWLISARDLATGSNQREIFHQFDLEVENIGAACSWAIDQNWWPRLIQGLPVLFLFHDSSSNYRYSEEVLRSSVERIRPYAIARPDDEQISTVHVLLLSLYSHSLLELNQLEEHQRYATESFTLLQKIKPSKCTAWAMIFIGFGYFLQNRQEVIQNIQSTYQLFESYNERRGMAIALAEWAGMLDTLHFETASEEAKNKLRQAIEWMEELNDPWMRARFLGSLARVHNFHGEYLQAKDYLLEALDIFNELGENWPVVDVRFDLGQNATWLGNYDEAEEYFSSSLNFLRTVETGPYYGAHLDCLGYIEYLRKNYDRAEEYYLESLSIYQHSHYLSGQVMDYNNLGDLARVRGDTDKAIEYYQKGIGLLPPDSEYWARSIIVKNLGNTMLELGELGRAEEYLREAQHYAELVERVPDLLEIDMSGAKLFAKCGNLERAVGILSMILDHPATTQVVHTEVQDLLNEISAELPKRLVREAVERGKLLQPGCAFLPEDGDDAKRSFCS